MVKQLLGPFSQMVTMDRLPDHGPLRDERLEIIRDGGLLIEDDRITEVLHQERFEQVRKEAEAKGSLIGHSPLKQRMVLLPGLIDAHTHICYAGSRSKDYARRLSGESYMEIADGGGGILSTVRQTRRANEEELYTSLAQRAFDHLLRGVTTCEVKSGYGLDIETELRMLRAIRRVNTSSDPYPLMVPTCLAAHACPPEFKSELQYLDFLVAKLLPVVKKEGLAQRVDIYVDRGAFPPHLADGFLYQAKSMGFSVVVHADQFTVGGVTSAARIGAVSADHLERSTEREFRWLQERDVVATVLPGSSLGLGEPFAHARRMLDLGLCVAIASDWNPGSAPMGNLLALAALLGANQRLTNAETFAGITCRAAKALSLTDRGVIRSGNVADLIGFPCDAYEEILYRQGALLPSFVMKGGRRVMRASNHLGA